MPQPTLRMGEETFRPTIFLPSPDLHAHILTHGPVDIEELLAGTFFCILF